MLKRFFKALVQNPILLGSTIVVIFVSFIAVFGTTISPHNPLETNLMLKCAPPTACYPLGNDALGRCLLSRILSGAWMSIGIGVSVVIISCLLGVTVGIISGYQGKLIDELLMRTTDIFLSLPEIVAAMTLAGLLGPGTYNMIFALSITGWMRYARLVRGITLSVKERDHVKVAGFSGCSNLSIIYHHILPANINSIIILSTIGLAKAIISVSALGFLGFGVQPPLPEWGTLLMEGKDYILSAPHLAIFPGIAVTLSVLAFNILGDGMRDFWDAERQ